MPKIADSKEYELKRIVRDTIVIDPMISLRRLQDRLFDKGYKTAQGNTLHIDYVAKLVRKVSREILENVARATVDDRIALLRERYRLVFDRLIRIAYYTEDLQKQGMPPPTYKDQIAALNAIIKLDAAILSAEMDMGLFERHLGTLEVEKRYIPLPLELKEKMMQAFQNLGFALPEPPKELEASKAEPNNANNGAAQNTQPAAL